MVSVHSALILTHDVIIGSIEAMEMSRKGEGFCRMGLDLFVSLGFFEGLEFHRKFRSSLDYMKMIICLNLHRMIP